MVTEVHRRRCMSFFFETRRCMSILQFPYILDVFLSRARNARKRIYIYMVKTQEFTFSRDNWNINYNINEHYVVSLLLGSTICILGHALAKLGNFLCMLWCFFYAMLFYKWITFLVHLEYAFYFLVTGEICTKY